MNDFQNIVIILVVYGLRRSILSSFSTENAVPQCCRSSFPFKHSSTCSGVPKVNNCAARIFRNAIRFTIPDRYLTIRICVSPYDFKTITNDVQKYYIHRVGHHVRLQMYRLQSDKLDKKRTLLRSWTADRRQRFPYRRRFGKKKNNNIRGNGSERFYERGRDLYKR